MLDDVCQSYAFAKRMRLVVHGCRCSWPSRSETAGSDQIAAVKLPAANARTPFASGPCDAASETALAAEKEPTKTTESRKPIRKRRGEIFPDPLPSGLVDRLIRLAVSWRANYS